MSDSPPNDIAAWQARLAESEKRLELVQRMVDVTQELTHVGGWEWDISAATMTWTRETYRIHGLAPDESNLDAGKVDASLACYDPQDRAELLEAFRRCIDDGESYDLILPFTASDGRRLWIRTMAKAVRENGRIVMVRGNIMDITSWKKNEDLLKARLTLSEAAACATLEELLQMTLDEAERLTDSQAGFFHFYEESSQTIQLKAWSSRTVRACAVESGSSAYPLSQAGCWAESIRRQTPIIHNHYPSLAERKDLPPGHIAVKRELAVPVLRNLRVVAVLGVGNKERDYQDEDLNIVSTLANLAWDIVLRKRAEEALHRSLEEKEVLLREVHHRVKNNMAAIIGLFEMQRRSVGDPASRAILDELGFRVRAMSLVHEKLYRSRSLSRIDFQEYCESLLAHLHVSLGSPEISYQVEARETAIPLDLAVPCGMIINELATNALKYAFPEKRRGPGQPPCLIRVALSREDQHLRLIVADNGIGLPDGLDWKNAPSLGLTLVRMLGMHQLGGSYQVERVGGTTFTLSFTPRETGTP